MRIFNAHSMSRVAEACTVYASAYRVSAPWPVLSHHTTSFQTQNSYSVYVCDVLMEKSFVIYKTPIGPLKLEASDEGICAVKWLFGKHSELPAGAAAAPPAQSETNGDKQEVAIATDGGRTECKGSKAKRHLQDCQSWLDAYFAGTLLKTNPPKPQLVLPQTGT